MDMDTDKEEYNDDLRLFTFYVALKNLVYIFWS